MRITHKEQRIVNKARIAEVENEKPTKEAEEAFRYRPYQTMSVMEYLEKLRRGADGQKN